MSADTITDFARAAARISHRPDCYAPRVVSRTGARGDALALCGECGRFVALAELERITARRSRPIPPQANPEPEPEPAPRRRKPRSLYYCRPHYHPVSWRGTGCPQCADAMVPRRKRPDPDTRAALARTD